MNPATVLTLARALYAATTDDDANALLLHAIEDGLSVTEAAAAFREWQQHRAASVTRLESNA